MDEHKEKIIDGQRTAEGTGLLSPSRPKILYICGRASTRGRFPSFTYSHIGDGVPNPSLSDANGFEFDVARACEQIKSEFHPPITPAKTVCGLQYAIELSPIRVIAIVSLSSRSI